MQEQLTPAFLDGAFRQRWPGQLATQMVTAERPKIAVAGHKKTGAPDLPSAIEDTKRYLQDFGRLTETATSDRELFDEMTGLYPDWVSNQSWLMFGLPLPTSLED
ncbi:MAG: hypothetical protein WCC28_21025 [Mycobacterium sp.]|uniref:hypothetical protein n=1 Tax=Mycobacterium sp. TaxID=1785 RepID=UPI003C778755